MSRGIDTLQLGVGLVHAVAGAELVLRCRSGHQLIAGSAASADVNICDLRRVMIASSCPARPNPSDWVEAVALKGVLRPCGGGIYRTNRDGCDERWFAASLRAEAVFQCLERLELEGSSSEHVEVVLKPDPFLGVTSVRVTVASAAPESIIDEAAIVAHGACLVEELLWDTTAQVDAPSSRRGRRRG